VIQNITENRPADVIFLDNDTNNQLSLADELYLIEADSLGNPLLTWAIHVQGNPNPVLPQAGDQFLLKTYKPVSAEDLFEFLGEINPILHAANQPVGFKLSNNYPNPFNPVTTIEFELSQKSQVTLQIFNILGEEVAVLVSGKLHAGTYQCKWDATGMASGVYLYQLTTGSFSEVKKMLLLK
jgi:hypothetical protein